MEASDQQQQQLLQQGSPVPSEDDMGGTVGVIKEEEAAEQEEEEPSEEEKEAVQEEEVEEGEEVVPRTPASYLLRLVVGAKIFQFIHIAQILRGLTNEALVHDLSHYLFSVVLQLPCQLLFGLLQALPKEHNVPPDA